MWLQNAATTTDHRHSYRYKGKLYNFHIKWIMWRFLGQVRFRDQAFSLISGSVNRYSYRILETELQDTPKIVMWRIQ
jgi:hypothetical protein